MNLLEYLDKFILYHIFFFSITVATPSEAAWFLISRTLGSWVPVPLEAWTCCAACAGRWLAADQHPPPPQRGPTKR
jgi:hypothetical protein